MSVKTKVEITYPETIYKARVDHSFVNEANEDRKDEWSVLYRPDSKDDDIPLRVMGPRGEDVWTSIEVLQALLKVARKLKKEYDKDVDNK